MLVLVVFGVSILTIHAQTIDYSHRSVSQLIDELTQLDSQSLGIDSAAVYDGFIADGSSGEFQVGVLGLPAPTVAPQMKELVRRGPAALPELLSHLNDSRPTKLAVGNDESKDSTHQVGVDTFMFSYFSDEYDTPLHYFSSEEQLENQRLDRPRPLEQNFKGRYPVKVGDVCFVLIGQIVNRRLLAVRYQPSAGLVVNSPVEVPSLAEKVRSDWSGKDAKALEASILADIRMDNHTKNGDWNAYATEYINSGLRRLRLYFPDTYRALTGGDLKNKREFERQAAAHQ
jgi:hypothetical protein